MPIDNQQWRAYTGSCATCMPLSITRINRPKIAVETMIIRTVLAVLIMALEIAGLYTHRTVQQTHSHTPKLLSSCVGCKRLQACIYTFFVLSSIVRMLLLLAGDIEENPGPPKKEGS